MSKFATVQAEGKVVSFLGKIRLLSSDGLNKRVELWLLNDKTNRNNWRYENLEQHRALFKGTPILISYKDGNLGAGHEMDEKILSDGTKIQSFMSATAERIVGRFESEDDIRIIEADGKRWIIGVGSLWAFYAPELAAELDKQGVEFPVSIETLIDEMHYEGTTEVFTKYRILGTTILGKDVSPAVADANIKALRAIGDDGMRQLTLRVASERVAAGENNPHKKSDKGVKTKTMKITELATKFPNFTVLAVNGKNAALLSDKGVPCVVTVDKDGEEIVCGAKTEVAANAVFGEGDDAVTVSVEAIAEALIARCNESENALAKANEEKDAALKALSDMQKAETERRKEAAKNAVIARLAAINANRENKIADAICDELITDERLCAYAEMVNAEGKWTGDACARKDVDALCMDEILKGDAERVNAAKRKYAWEDGANAASDDDGIMPAVKRIMG